MNNCLLVKNSNGSSQEKEKPTVQQRAAYGAHLASIADAAIESETGVKQVDACQDRGCRMKPLTKADDIKINSLTWNAEDATNEAIARQATKCGYDGPRAAEEYLIGMLRGLIAGDEEDT